QVMQRFGIRGKWKVVMDYRDFWKGNWDTPLINDPEVRRQALAEHPMTPIPEQKAGKEWKKQETVFNKDTGKIKKRRNKLRKRRNYKTTTIDLTEPLLPEELVALNRLSPTAKEALDRCAEKLVAIGEQSQREQDKMLNALMDSTEFEFTFEEGHHHPVLSQITLDPETVQEMIDFQEPDHDHDDSSSVISESTRNAESDPAELVPESDSEFES